MKKRITHVDGLSGVEEYLAVKMLNDEIEKLNQFFPDIKDGEVKYPEDVDDSGCNEDTNHLENFNETSYLEDCVFSTYGDLEGEPW